MKTLEIVIRDERMGAKWGLLQQVWPNLAVTARTKFYVVLACQVEVFSAEQKTWLEDLHKEKEIIHFCCKERGRTR